MYKLLLILSVFVIPFISLAQPANNDCSGTVSVTPNGTCIGGTTVAATDSWVGLVGCQGGNANAEHEDVWYSFVSGGSSFTTTITAGAGWAGNVEFVLWSNAGGCGGTFTQVATGCGASPLTVATTGLTVGQTYYMTVANPANGTLGAFTICTTTSTPAGGCTDNDACIDAAVITLNASSAGASCVTDCNTGAAPGIDFVGNICEDMGGPTVWYEFTTDAGAATMDIDLTGLTNPEFTLWANSCSPWTIIAGSCTEGAGGVASATINVSPNTTYILSVSDVNGVQGTFNLCVDQNLDASLCNVSDVMTETASSDPTTPVGGPYSAGETVSFCYTVLQFKKENCNWLMGIVPDFGNCWSPTSFNASGMPITSTPPAVAGNETGTWAWYAAGQIFYNNIIGSLPANSPMPGGWYFQCNTCGLSNADPDLSWGDGGAAGAPQNDCDINGNGYTWTTCFTLIAGTNTNCTNGTTDCTIEMKTYADGEIGGYNNTGCTGDLPLIVPASFLCCVQPVITPVANQAICTNSAINIALTSNQAPTVTYSWTVVAGANITGAIAGSGALINQTLLNSGTTPQTAVYTVTGNNGSCTSVITFTITVNPNATIALTSAAGTNAQALCLSAVLTNITYAIGGGGTGGTVSGLPTGLTGTYSGGVFTIFGTPTQTGTFSYTVTTTGTCTQTSAVGTITINPNATIALTSAVGTNAQTLCATLPINNITYAIGGGGTGGTVSGLPTGLTGTFSGGTFTISGTPTQTGSFSYTVTTTGTCAQTSASGTITINPNATIALTSAAGTNAQILCASLPITNITYSIGGGGTGGTVSGLPTGLSGTYSGGVFTIFGTPTQTGTFSYTVTTTGTCAQTSATGTITINPNATIALTSAVGTNTQTLCATLPITNITYAIGGGGTGGTVSGLPTGLTGTFSGGTFTISGTPTQTGTFSYTVTTTGTCAQTSASGTITINPNATIALTSAAGTNAQILCASLPITNITYSIGGGGTGGTVSGLPTGLTGTYSGGVFTIFGTPTQTGTFSYTVTTTGTCAQTSATGTITINANPVITLTPNSPSSCNGTNGSILVNGAGTGTVFWTGPSAGSQAAVLPNTINGLGAGTYNVYFVNTATSCQSATVSTTLNNPGAPILDVIIDVVQCGTTYTLPAITGPVIIAPQYYTLPGGPSGGGTIVPVGTVYPVPTNITLYAYDVSGICFIEEAFNITLNALPTVTTVSGGGSFCAGALVSPVVANVTGAVNWSVNYTLNGVAQAPVSGSATPITLGTNPGVYIVTNITDNNCSNAASGTQTITINALPTVASVTGGNTYCAGAAVAPVVAAVTGVANWSINYTLNGVAQTAATGLTSPITLGTAPGVYVVTGILDNNCSNTGSGTQTITINALPTVSSVNGGNTYCIGDAVLPVTASVTGAANWSVGYTLDGVLQAPATGSVSPLTLGILPGVYVVTGITDNNCTNSATGTQTIIINALPTVTAVNGTNTYCAGDVITPITVDVTGAANWSVNYTLDGVAQTAATGASSPITLGTAPGVYVVTGISDNNCSNTASGTQTITINALPTVTSVTGGNTYCAGDNISPVLVDVTGEANWFLTYTLDGVSQTASGATSPITLGVAAGIYVVTDITDNNCTNTAAGTQTIIINATPTFTLLGANPGACSASDGSVTLSGLNPSSSSYDITYDDDGAAISITLSSDVAGDIIIGSLNAGTYDNFTVSLGGCLGTSATQVILVDPGAPIITNPGAQTACDSYSLPAISGTSLSGNEAYYDNSQALGGMQITGPITSTQTVWIYDVAGICVDEESFLVTINVTPLVANPGDQVACGSYTLPAINGTNLSGNESYYSVSGGTGTAMSAGDIITTDQTVYIYDFSGACSDEEFFAIDINTLPTVTSIEGGNTYCSGDVVNDILVNVTGAADWTIEYTLNGEALTLTGTSSPVSLGNAAGVYVVTGLTDLLCANSSNESETIVVNPIPSAPTAGIDTTYCTSWTAVPMFANGSGGSITWYSNSALTTIVSSTPAEIAGTTSYYVTETLNGCEGLPSIVNITFEQCTITVPTAFTPDGDGVNEDWRILDLDETYPNNVVRVYNRWGSLIFEHDSKSDGTYDTNRWDGSYNGDALPIGSYYFIIDYNDDEKNGETGTVSILKK